MDSKILSPFTSEDTEAQGSREFPIQLPHGEVMNESYGPDLVKGLSTALAYFDGLICVVGLCVLSWLVLTPLIMVTLTSSPLFLASLLSCITAGRERRR